ncbi:RNA polymerase Rpb1, domain protein 1 domain protein [mine drainage metagenome]|uniref:DNA-directed RNA polymerase n=1 Tax=mine drainage metagenome TaxID=410659 RepID=T0ZNS4_9ZZZZ
MNEGISKRIFSINFALLSPEEIRKMSQIKVITADTYDDDGYPIERGLMDLHLGVIEPGLKCATCGGKVDECPGHFGHIELAMPVVHVGFIKEIKTFLDAACGSCGHVKLVPERLNEFNAKIKEIEATSTDPDALAVASKRYIEEASAASICPYCGAHQKRYSWTSLQLSGKSRLR